MLQEQDHTIAKIHKLSRRRTFQLFSRDLILSERWTTAPEVDANRTGRREQSRTASSSTRMPKNSLGVRT